MQRLCEIFSIVKKTLSDSTALVTKVIKRIINFICTSGFVQVVPNIYNAVTI